MDYIIIPNIGKIVIDYTGEEKFVKETDDGEVIFLTDEEKKYIKNLLRNPHPEVVYDEQVQGQENSGMPFNKQGWDRALEIINSNKSLNGKEDLTLDVCHEIFEGIPAGAEENFLRNLADVKIEVPDYMQCEPSKDGYGNYGVYNGIANSISFNGSHLRYIYDQSNGDKEAVAQEIRNILRHEMDHMASCNYDRDNNILTMGFMRVDMNTGNELGRAFNEGYTQPVGIGYVFQRSVANRVSSLMEMTGQGDKMERMYYTASGPKALKDEFIKAIQPDSDSLHKDGSNFAFGLGSMNDLLTSMDLELAFRNATDDNIITSIPANIQGNLNKCLLNAFKTKIDMAKTDQERADIIAKANECIRVYARTAIKPEMVDDIKKFPGIESTMDELGEAILEIGDYRDFTEEKGKNMEVPNLDNTDEIKNDFYNYFSTGDIKPVGGAEVFQGQAVSTNDRQVIESEDMDKSLVKKTEDIKAEEGKTEFTKLKQEITGYSNNDEYDKACEKSGKEWEATKSVSREKSRDISKHEDVVQGEDDLQR